jgi:hypothetical protein
MRAVRYVQQAPKKRASSRPKTYALCVSVNYPGDFALDGRHWRIVTGTAARSAKEAILELGKLDLKTDFRYYLATDYPPALDVLKHRTLVRETASTPTHLIKGECNGIVQSPQS